MSRRPPLPDGPWLVVGLARSGVAAARLLAPHGEVIGVDAGTPEVSLDGVEVHLGHDGVDLLERVRCVVKSPGVPREAPVIAAALRRGTTVIGELELAWRALERPFLAVTGTNGKTTTVELLGAMFRAAGRPVAVAGNVGTPLAALTGLDPAATVVCEASSFQLEDTVAFAPECALLLNVEEDHLDRHGTLDAYRAAKLLAFARQRPGDAAVAPAAFALPGEGARVTFGGAGADLELSAEELRWRGEQVVAASEIRLRGAHNLENAMGASAAALAAGLPVAAVAEGLRTFAGVAHRLEEVARVGGVLYVNDSKATNPASARRGLESFPGGLHAILGGSLKAGGYASLREPLAQRARAAYLVGPAAEPLRRDLEGAVALHDCGTLERAVAAARAAAEPGDVVLLSPACASFDAFRDFEQRGARFRELVRDGE